MYLAHSHPTASILFGASQFIVFIVARCCDGFLDMHLDKPRPRSDVHIEVCMTMHCLLRTKLTLSGISALTISNHAL